MKPITDIICLWIWNKNKNKWEHNQTINVTEDNYEIDEFMYNNVGHDVMGCCVTKWSMRFGIKLIAFHPPKWEKWIGCGLYEKLISDQHWTQYIEDGSELSRFTYQEALRLIFKHKNNMDISMSVKKSLIITNDKLDDALYIIQTAIKNYEFSNLSIKNDIVTMDVWESDKYDLVTDSESEWFRFLKFLRIKGIKYESKND